MGVKKFFLRLGLVILVLGLCVGGFFAYQAITDPHDCRIVEGVQVGGLDLGGRTRSEAKKVLQSALEGRLLSEDLTVSLPQGTISLTPEQIIQEVDVAGAVKDAYRFGRKDAPDSGELDLLSYVTLDQDAIRSALEAYAAEYDTTLTGYSYHLEGSMPELSVDAYEESAPCQTLVLTTGIPTVKLDVEATMEQILAVYSCAAVKEQEYTVKIEEIVPLELPQVPDIGAIYGEICTDPVDDSLDMQTYQLIPGAYGYQFDQAAATEALNRAEPGETIRIPLNYVEPEIIGEEVYFRDVLGFCDTKHSANENRNTNLRLLCEALDGVILQPGEDFSYNETVGERTAEKGYKPAPAYSGNRLTDAIGGGVCQGSSTLYNCVLLADLEVVERVCHGATVSYLPLGLDAAVNWGTTDFKFRNNANFPIMIKAEVSDGYVRMKILGTDEKDYYIKMTSGYDDSNPGYIMAVSYKNKYDKKTNELISKEREAFSTYYRNIG